MKTGTNKGFTLLEVIIVIIILAILASVAAPRIIGGIRQAQASEGLKMLGVVRTEAENCYQMQTPNSYTNCGTLAILGLNTWQPKYFSTPVAGDIVVGGLGATLTVTLRGSGQAGELAVADTLTLTCTGATGQGQIVGAGALAGINQ